MEAYMDNIIVKSRRSNQYVENLDEVFNILKKYNIKLNLEKCVF